jgi:hypothetical protein
MIQAPTPAPTPPLPPPGGPPFDPSVFSSETFPEVVAILGVMLAAALVLRWLFRSPIGEAIAERIRHGRRRHWGALGEDPRRVGGLEEQVSHLQGQVSELAERLDFAERLLAERRERTLGAGQ